MNDKVKPIITNKCTDIWRYPSRPAPRPGWTACRNCGCHFQCTIHHPNCNDSGQHYCPLCGTVS